MEYAYPVVVGKLQEITSSGERILRKLLCKAKFGKECLGLPNNPWIKANQADAENLRKNLSSFTKKVSFEEVATFIL